MKTAMFSLAVGILIASLLGAFSYSAYVYLGGGLVAFIATFMGISTLTSGGPMLIEESSMEAVTEARSNLNTIRVSAIALKNDHLVQAAADLESEFEAVFVQISTHRNGYAQVVKG